MRGSKRDERERERRKKATAAVRHAEKLATRSGKTQPTLYRPGGKARVAKVSKQPANGALALALAAALGKHPFDSGATTAREGAVAEQPAALPKKARRKDQPGEVKPPPAKPSRRKRKAEAQRKGDAARRKRTVLKSKSHTGIAPAIKLTVTKAAPRPKTKAGNEGARKRAEEYRKAYNAKAAAKVRGQTTQNVSTSLKELSLKDLRSRWLVAITNWRGASAGDEPSPWQSVCDQIEAEWAYRATEHPDYFDWPSTDARPGDGNLGKIEWQETGMLGYLGYRVGKTSELSKRQREALLSYTFSMRLPRINSEAYMRGWGAPASAPRLAKIAESLAAFVRLRKQRHDNVFVEAVGQWEDDLRYLYERYYVGQFRFAWPTP